MPRLFPHRSRPRSSAKAPVGGLKPPPARRLRRSRIFLHLLVQHREHRAISSLSSTFMFTKSSANAAVGGFKPPPAGRLRRAYLHLSRSTASRCSAYIKLPSAFVTHRTGTPRSWSRAVVCERCDDASAQPARVAESPTQQRRFGSTALLPSLCVALGGDPPLTGAAKNNAGRKLRRNTNIKIKEIVVYAGQIRWPGAWSNRRPSDFQDFGAVSVSGRQRP
jgi:hypothetical protein